MKALAALLTLAASSAAALTPVKPYLVSLDPAYEVVPILSVGERMPDTDDPSREYQMVGIPDGMGAHDNGDGTHTLYLSYELTGPTLAEPHVGGPLQRGSYVSQYVVDADGNVLSGRRAFDEVYFGNDLVGPAAEVGNATPAFNRFCSAFLAGPNVGLDRWIYLAGEESEGTATFDGRGGVGVAIYDGEAHVLPRLGRYAKENLLVMRGTGQSTVIMGLEDGPSTPDSQLWMYVGRKERNARGNALRRNGLDNGSLYVLRAVDPAVRTEGDFRSGVLRCEWVAIPGADAMTDAALEAAADAAGAFGFVRVEDGAFNPRQKDELFFVTTGSSWTPAGAPAPANKLGRLYALKIDRKNLTGPCELQVVYNADDIIAEGGDVALSPDNMDVSEDALVIQEDGTAESRVVMGAKGRDGSIWSFPLTSLGWQQRVDLSGRVRVAELDPPGRDGVAVGPGVWESSGIIDASEVLDEGDWIVNVQAHRPTAAPAPNTVEDGQVLWLRRR